MNVSHEREAIVSRSMVEEKTPRMLNVGEYIKMARNHRAMELTDDTLRWAASRGIQGTTNLQVAEFKRPLTGKVVRSLAVKSAVKAGDVVLSVPANAVLSSSSNETLAYLTPLLNNAALPTASLHAESHQLRLTVALLVLHNFARTEWGPYFGSLPSPSEYRESHPTLAQASLLDAFRDLPIVDKIKQQQMKRAEHLSEFWTLGGRVSPEDWEWAEVVVSSRAWADADGAASGITLVPIADFIKAGLEADQNVYTVLGDPSKKEPFKVVAKRDIAAGEELLDNYIQASDDVWAESWGILVPGNGVRHQPALLDRFSCRRLAAEAGPSMSAQEEVCKAPEGVLQKEAFCTLAQLAAEHCPDYIPCPTSLCGPRSAAIVRDFHRAHTERPALLWALFLLFAILMGVRGANLLSLKSSSGNARRPAYRAPSAPACYGNGAAEGCSHNRKPGQVKSSQVSFAPGS